MQYSNADHWSPREKDPPISGLVTDDSLHPAPPLIVERDAELEALDAAVESVCRGRGGLVVIDGEAGIGKSALVDQVARRAHVRGMTVLRARGTELERQYPYGTAIRLFDPLVVASPHTLLRGPAAAVGTLFEQPGAGSGDQFTTVHGLFWLAVNATDERPLLIVVDDAQWADEASLRFLHYLAQRLQSLSIVIVAAFRSTEPEADEPSAAAIRLDPGATQLAPRPLSEAGVGALLQASGGPADAGVVREIWSASGGNPFLVSELDRDRRSPRKGSDGHVHVPDRVARFVQRRVRRLDTISRRIAEAVAVLGDEATARRAARLADVSDDAAADALGRLTAAAIVDDSSEIGFIHPLVRAAVYQAMPAVARARTHRRAALLLDDEHEPLGVVAGQLLPAEPASDPRVVDLLLGAAREALTRGEPAIAGTLLRRALVEPPQARRIEVLRLLGLADVALGAPTAVDRYEEALALIGDDPHERASMLLELGGALVNRGDFRGAATTFQRGVVTIGDGDRDLRARLEAGYLSASWVGVERGAEITSAVSRILAEPSLGPTNRELAVWTAFHRSIAARSSFQEPLALVRRVLGEAPIGTLIGEGQLVELAAGALLTTDELALETDLLDRSIEAAQAVGAFGKVAVYSYCRAWPAYFGGRLTDAIADAQAALAAAQLGWETFVPATHSVLALALLEREQLADASAVADADATAWQNRVDYFLIPIAQGRIALAQGNPQRATELFRAASVGPELMGVRSPAPVEWRNWLSVACARQGLRDEAIAIADEAVEITRTWGARWPQGPAYRAAGIAHGGDAGLELLRESVALLDGGPARLELARSLVELGAALRRQGRLVAAREALTRGMDVAFRTGAIALLRQSRDELRAAGSRPRRLALSGAASLTPSEERVARLAATGRTNREIAEALFVTPKTVEYHLANVYAKLGIESRAQLGGALASDAAERTA